MNEMDAAFNTFLVECEELLQDMEDRLIALEDGGEVTEAINSIFRDIHTIKGSAGLFGLDSIVTFTHVVESVLDKARGGFISLDDDLTSLMLNCKDHVNKLIESIDGLEVNLSDGDKEVEHQLMARLKERLEGIGQTNTESEENVEFVIFKRESPANVVSEKECFDNDNWHISVHFSENVLQNGMDPLSILRYLNTIGEIKNIVTLFDKMPTAPLMDPEICYLAYEINFHSEMDKAAIESAFEFIKDDCILHIVPPHGKMQDFIDIIEDLSDEDLKLGEILVKCGTITDRELNNILDLQSALASQTEERAKLGEIVVEDKLARPEVVEAALNKQATLKKSKEKLNQTVRVDANKLDNLINLIGELVIAGAGMNSEIREVGATTLREHSLTLNRLIEDVRDGALNLRMVHIGETFNRFHRVVRDVSKELNKTIELEISGAETELDKSVVEKISDPLMHLVRNAIDHGIENAEQRVEQGKDPSGKLKLNAYHESGSIIIEVMDDGRGLSPEKILSKAREKGLVDNGVELSDQEIFQLIFEAGFSTAEKISNISGRGVGMDVVRRNIEALRGSIDIESGVGSGTIVRIRLPLTLAIIDGFLMGVGDASYVVPLDIVEECIELTDNERDDNSGRNYINLRGEVLPFIRLRENFNANGKSGKRENIVVVKYGNQKAGFVVDTLLGELQTVIKPMGALFQNLSGISGSTILGSGEVALILDSPSLIQKAVNQI